MEHPLEKFYQHLGEQAKGSVSFNYYLDNPFALFGREWDIWSAGFQTGYSAGIGSKEPLLEQYRDELEAARLIIHKLRLSGWSGQNAE